MRSKRRCCTLVSLPWMVLLLALALSQSLAVPWSPWTARAAAGQSLGSSSCQDDGSFVSVLAPASVCTESRNAYRDLASGRLYLSCSKSGIVALPPSAQDASGGSDGPVNATVILTAKECASAAWVTRDVVRNITYAACSSGVIAVEPSGAKRALTGAGECSATSIAVDQHSGVIYVSCALQGVMAINGSTSRRFIADGNQCYLGQSVVVHPRSGRVYAACRNNGLIEIAPSQPPLQHQSLLEGDYTVRSLLNKTRCSSARSVVQASSGAIYVACFGSGADSGVFRVNATSGAVTRAAKQGQCQTTTLALDATGSTLFVGCFLNGVFAVQASVGDGDSAADAPFTNLATSVQCHLSRSSGVSFDSLTGAVLASCEEDGVLGVQGSTVTTLVNAGQCPRPGYLVWDAQRSDLLVTCLAGDLLQLEGTRVRTLISSALCTRAKYALRDEASGVLFVSCESGLMTVHDGRVAKLLSSDHCIYPRTMLYEPSSRVLTVACYSSGAGLMALHLSNNSLAVLSSTRIIPFAECDLPKHVWKDPNTGILYVCCEGQSVTPEHWTLVRLFPSGRVEGLMRSRDCNLPSHTLQVPWDSQTVYVVCQQQGGVKAFHLDAESTGRSSNISVLLGPDQCDGPQSLEVGPWDPADPEQGGALLVGCNNGVLRVRMRGGSVGSAGLAPTSSLAAAPSISVSTVLTSAQCSGALAVSYHPSSGEMYAACSNTGAVVWSEDFRCHTGYSWVQGGCVPCGAGSFRTASSIADRRISWGCSPCAKGSVAPFLGTTECTICPSGTRANTEENLCTPCSPGSAQPDRGATECPECTRGHAVAVLGASTCSSCLPGYYAETNGTFLCAACAPGRFQASPGQSTCVDCEPGSYNDSPGQSTCLSCAPGRFASNHSSLSCTPCAPGTLRNASGGTECAACDPGSFASLPQATECAPCAPGSAAGDRGALSCALCVPGTYQPASGATECLAALPGQFVSRTGLTRYELCEVGTASDSNRTVECTRCARGSVQGLPGQSQCAFCEPGKYSDVTGGSLCLDCEAGSYATQRATVECSSCYPGSASNATGLARECPPCPPGSYQPGSSRRATSCQPCSGSTFADQPGSAQCSFCATRVNENRTSCGATSCEANTEYSQESGQCETCPLGSFSARGGSCSPCPLGLYTPRAGSGCVSCQQGGMEGLVCVGGLASVREGFWAFLAPPDRSGLQLYVTAPCPPNFCPGAQLQSLPSPPGSGGGDWSNSSSHLNSSVVYCVWPRVNSDTNVLCGACVPGFIPWGDKCVRCEGPNGPLLFGALVLSFVLVLFLLRSSAGGSSAGGVAVLLYFVQTAALEVGSSSRNLAWLAVFNFGTDSTSDCIAPWSPYEQMLVSICMPLLLLAELGVVAIAHLVLHKHFRAHGGVDPDTDVMATATAVDATSDSASSKSGVAAPVPWCLRARRMLVSLVWDYSCRRYVAACMSILLFSYTQVTVACVSYLYCVEVGPQRVLFTSPTIDCASDAYRRHLVVVVVVFAIFVVGFPFAVVAGLWRHRRVVWTTAGQSKTRQQQLQHQQAQLSTNPRSHPLLDSDECASPSKTQQHASDEVSSDADADVPDGPSQFQQTWGPLYSMFAPRALYWQPLVLLRRASFVLTSVLLVQQHSTRFLVFGLLHFASLLAHLYVRPFVDAASNRAETASYVLLVVVSGLLSGDVPPYSVAVQVVAFLLLVPPAAVLAAIVLRQQWHDVHAKLNARRDAALAQQLQREQELDAADSVRAAYASGSPAVSHGDVDCGEDVGAPRGIDIELPESAAVSPRSPSAGLARYNADQELVYQPPQPDELEGVNSQAL